MNRPDLEQILQSKYSRQNWLELIKNISPNPDIHLKPKPLDLDKNITKQGFELGSFETSDGMLIGLYEIRLTDKPQIERNRVGLRNLLRKYYNKVDGCFAVYVSKDKWRFSYISETRVKDESGEWTTTKTEPKRYTYVLGEGETVRTAVDRFDTLFQSNKTIQNIKDAFSVEKVTDEFFRELRDVYNEIQEMVSGINDKHKKTFAQLTINRLLFLKFLEKKGWLFVNKTDSLEERRRYFDTKRKSLASKNQWKNFFVHLFFSGLNHNPFDKKKLPDDEKIFGFVPYLNGGLFEESKYWNEYDLEIDNSLFGYIFDSLLNRFNFTVSENTPLDIEVALNPDLLGYAYEEMISEQHGQGAYYTHPTEVGLMCREVLKTYLREHCSIEYGKLSKLIDNWNSEQLTEEEALSTFGLLLKVRILDPAVGSGAYPVRMMQELVEINYSLSGRLSGGVLKQIIRNKLTDPTSFYALKKSIIQNNLYGVDIDRFAIEIAKLRFWLSMVVDFDPESKEVKTADDLNKIPSLPNLDFKLRVGDSLVATPGKSTKRNLYAKEVGGEILNFDIYFKQHTPDIFLHKKTSRLSELKSLFFDFEETQKNDRNLQKTTKDILREQISKLEKDIAADLGLKIQDYPESLNHIIWQIHFAEIFDEKTFGFDICIANPPYLRQEKINELFQQFESGITKDDLVQTYEHLFRFKDVKLKIDKKSDLYIYFFLRGLNLLKEKGVLCYICSNSWLDVGYGKCLQEVLLRNTRIIGIYDNSAVRSFKKADVNTTINLFVKNSSVDYKDQHKKLNTDNLARFVTFKDKFEKVAISEDMEKIDEATVITSNEDWRVYPIPQGQLLKNGLDEDRKYEGDKWGGKYLRAPDVFFTILEKGKEKFVRLGDIAEVKRGFTTGANEFFYLDETKIAEWGIESEFLKPVIKSPRECKSILIDTSQLRYQIFMCNKQKKELKWTNALKYIEWGEEKEYSKNETVLNRPLWYSCPQDLYGNTFWVKETNDRIGAFVSNEKMLSDCRLYYANCSTKMQNVVNSTLSALIAEIMCRSGLGEGARSLMVYEVNQFLILNPSIFKMNKLAFNSRPLYSIFAECGFPSSNLLRNQKPNPLPDRKALDDIIFNALGLTQEERNEVYYSVCELVQNRLIKARSFKP